MMLMMLMLLFLFCFPLTLSYTVLECSCEGRLKHDQGAQYLSVHDAVLLHHKGHESGPTTRFNFSPAPLFIPLRDPPPPGPGVGRPAHPCSSSSSHALLPLLIIPSRTLTFLQSNKTMQRTTRRVHGHQLLLAQVRDQRYLRRLHGGGGSRQRAEGVGGQRRRF